MPAETRTPTPDEVNDPRQMSLLNKREPAVMFWNKAARQRTPHTSAEGPMYRCALAENQAREKLERIQL